MASSVSKAGGSPTIAIMNGTSRTGAQVAELALAAGSHVHLIVRSAARVSKALMEPKPAPKLHIHELRDMFDAVALRPILAEVDFLILAFVVPAARALDPTSLNQDGAIAAVSAIMAATPGGTPPRTRIILLSSSTIHPEEKGFARTFATKLLPYQMEDLRRTEQYLRAQEAWGLQWAALNPGGILETAPEPDSVRRDDVEIASDISALGGKFISYGRLGGSFLKIMADWPRWRNRNLVPVPLGAPVRGSSDLGTVLMANVRRLARTATWWTVLLAVGWQVGCRFGDLGTNAWLHGLTTGWRS